ncbi:MAG: DinB family protein [Dehalococcoidia bacterium]
MPHLDKAAIEDLYAYTGWVWRQIAQTAGPGDDVLSRPAPGSGWPTLGNCLGHIVLAYDRWLPAIIDLESKSLPESTADDFATWAQIEAIRSRVRGELKSHLTTWSDEELATLQDTNIDGETIRYSRGELITHLLLHERGHHGDALLPARNRCRDHVRVSVLPRTAFGVMIDRRRVIHI